MTRQAATVGVVDDEEAPREAVVGLLRSAGLRAIGFASARELEASRKDTPLACLVLDVDMPESDGLALQSRLSAAGDRVPIVFLSGHASVAMSVRAIKAGAVDFFTKPVEADALIESVLRVVSASPPPDQPPGPVAIPGIVGTSAALQGALQQMRTVAATDTTVLIQGETGTGKERIAHAVHELSPRRSGPFVKLNCAAVPDGLLESELMGHEKGAFTGALTQRIGRFELAHGGTIFLDEIGEMPLDLQPKLLRLLQEKELERVGGNRTICADVRVVAATHRDLRAMVAQRAFREDLYYRLSVFPIELPPLRDRREDIPTLVRHFTEELVARMGRAPVTVGAEALQRLVAHDWPGNVRELQNVIERAVILARGVELEVPLDAITVRAQRDPPPTGRAPSDGLAQVSRAHILRVLEDTNWVVAGPRGAAARLEMKRTTLAFRMKKLGLVRPGPSA